MMFKKLYYNIGGFFALNKLNRARRKDVLPKNSKKLYTLIKKSGRMGKVK